MHKLKGIYDIPRIDDLLKEKGIDICWTIIGDGPEKLPFSRMVADRKNFLIHTPPDTKSVFELIQHCDLFLLPSSLDGTPVALLEAMSVGLVPIVYEFNPGIKNIVTEEIGYIIQIGDIEKAAKIIEMLHFSRENLEQLSNSALKRVTEKYDIKDRAKEYYNLFINYKNLKKDFKIEKPSRNRLDHPLIPVRLATYLRNIRKQIAR